MHDDRELSTGAGRTPSPCRSSGDCRHRMVRRCPGCHREMYAPAVWDFSHGTVTCSCGHTVTPKVGTCRYCGQPLDAPVEGCMGSHLEGVQP